MHCICYHHLSFHRHGPSVTSTVGNTKAMHCTCYYHLLLQRHGTSVTARCRITKATDLHLLLPHFIPTPWNCTDNSVQEHQGQDFYLLLAAAASPKYSRHFSGPMRPQLPGKLFETFRTFHLTGTSVTTRCRNTKAMAIKTPVSERPGTLLTIRCRNTKALMLVKLQSLNAMEQN
jgi:hypothetical protein